MRKEGTHSGEKRKWPQAPKRSEAARRKKKSPNLATVTTPIQMSVCQYLCVFLGFGVGVVGGGRGGEICGWMIVPHETQKRKQTRRNGRVDVDVCVCIYIKPTHQILHCGGFP